VRHLDLGEWLRREASRCRRVVKTGQASTCRRVVKT
jgi:hypothetical protein